MSSAPVDPGFFGPLFGSAEDIERFGSELHTGAVGRKIVFCPRTTSTNDLALAGARQGAPHGTLYIADEQTSGRGRRGRSWAAPPRLGLLFSVLIRPVALAPADFGWLSLLAGWAAAEGLRRACALEARLKWPNDVVLPCLSPPGWKKLGGILGESALDGRAQAGPRKNDYFVLGIGLNINQQQADLPPSSKMLLTSARLEKGKPFVRTEALRAVLEQLDKRLDGLARSGEGLAECRQSLEDGLRQWWTPEKKLQLQWPAANGARGPSEGAFAGLDPAGRLRIQTAAREELVSGDAEILAVV